MGSLKSIIKKGDMADNAETVRENSEFISIFSKVPDAPLFSRFKLGFADHIALMFQRMVDYTEPICHTIDSSLASILTFDTSAWGLRKSSGG